jgi:hypothetical protein
MSRSVDKVIPNFSFQKKIFRRVLLLAIKCVYYSNAWIRHGYSWGRFLLSISE